MAERLRFHLDEHVDPIVAQGLRQHGIDVVTTREAGLLGRGDQDHLRFATQSGRVIVTHDADFLRLSASGASHQGVAFCQLGARSPGEMIRRLILLWEVLEPAEMADTVEFL